MVSRMRSRTSTFVFYFAEEALYTDEQYNLFWESIWAIFRLNKNERVTMSASADSTFVKINGKLRTARGAVAEAAGVRLARPSSTPAGVNLGVSPVRVTVHLNSTAL
jgi:hypothetical protein